MSDSIIIRDAYEHNLKHVDLEIPRDAMVVITGVSGSGKSSIAFDTIFQEGQRRYVESLSAYARQFIGSMRRPLVESIRGISPTISIDQKTINRNPRSTVGTVIEITDHYRLLFARLGIPHCPQCGKEIQAQTVEQIADGIFFDYPGESLLVLAPLIQERKGEYRKELKELLEAGFQRVRIDGTLYRTEEAPALERYEKHTIEAVIDRLVVENKNLPRLRQGIEQALRLSQNHLVAFWIGDHQYQIQSTELGCPQCRLSIPELEPRLFSFNDPQGQCPHCKGLGRRYEFVVDKMIPDPALSLRGGALKPQVDKGHIMFTKHGWAEFEALARHYQFSLDTPWNQLKPKAKKVILYGSDEPIQYTSVRRGWRGRRTKVRKEKIPGVIPLLQELWDRWHMTMLTKYMSEERCQSCQGTRLNEVARAVQFHGHSIHELSAWTVEQSTDFFQHLQLSTREETIGQELFKEIRNRLGFLQQVGLGYLSLDRGAATLSGGEAQRMRLASQVGAGLQGVIYVLDEPSIGLHPRDNENLLDILSRLRQAGNSLIIVEHDEETMRQADYVVDVGPGAGREGGRIVAHGHWEEMARQSDSLTGQYLCGKRRILLPEQRRQVPEQHLEILGARANNLQNLHVQIPIGIMTAITGVSGSGKSTLINQILRKAVAAHFHGAEEPPGEHDEIRGLEYLNKVIEIDQSPIGRTPRSNPATYTKIFDEIRQLFALLPEAKIRGYSKSRFSFNVAGGRCDACNGAGVQEIEMQILPNVQVTCEVCDGKRFNHATLEIHYKGKTIADVLALTIGEALDFFADHPKIARPLQVLHDIGLGYLTLGQPSTTLSGGEAQRMKISTELRRPATGSTLYLLDEPTTGLHFEDIQRLLECMQKLVDSGNTLVVIEHNLEVIKCADWIIDLGPEGGQQGGQLVCEGTPEYVAEHPESRTAPFLKQALKDAVSPARALPPKPRTQSGTRIESNARYPIHPIQVQGARKHNLRNLDVSIPRHQITVITGLSGSGKSSLAFHTLFSEGQRRFVESLSTYARRFLGKMDRGSIDSIHGLAPAIAIDQGSASRSPRSTVATLTEIYDYFRIFWARLGRPHCPHCHKPAESFSPSSLADLIEKNQAGSMLSLYFPVFLQDMDRNLMITQANRLSQFRSRLMELGYQRIWIDGNLSPLASAKFPARPRQVMIQLDRIQGKRKRTRLVEGLEKAFEEGNGLLALQWDDSPLQLYSQTPGCASCGWFMEQELDPRHFSFNSHWGACETCQGLGTIDFSVCPDCGGERLKPEFLNVRLKDQNISQVTAMTISQASQWFTELPLNRVEKQIAAPLLQEIQGRLEFLQGVGLHYLGLDRAGDTLSGGEAQRIRLASQIGSGLEGVLYVLDEPTVGLHQRDTRQLIETLYRLRDLGNTLVVVEHDHEMIRSADHIIDMGPHAGEEGGLIVAQTTPKALARKNAPQKYPDSWTARYLSGKCRIEDDFPEQNRTKEEPRIPLSTEDTQRWIQLSGLFRNNLQDVSVQIPTRCLTVVSGVSGSGKSSLVMDCLYPLASQRIARKRRKNGVQGTLQLPDEITEVVLVDQNPIGGTPRSTPVSYTKVFDKIRALYAKLPESKIKGYTAGRFSYNAKSGRCEVCEGRGYQYIEMHFLSNVWEKCEHCQGRRYNTDTLAVTWKGKSIADVLEMRVHEAVSFFAQHANIVKPLQVLQDIGLGYLRLGQSATTLSGGEAQRLKLGAELARNSRQKILYLLDEPTTGLHSHDIRALWGVLQRLVEQGHTVVLVEHQMDMIRLADYLIDMGPEGGEAGGQILFQGKPSDYVRLNKQKYPTWLALRNHQG